MNWNTTPAKLSILVTLGLLGAGCAASQSTGPATAQGAPTDASEDGGSSAAAGGNGSALPEESPELIELKQVCESGKRDGAELSMSEEDEACQKTANLMGENMAAAGCGAIEEYWEQSIAVDSDIKPLLHNSYGKKAAECGRWDIVFEDLMHWGNGTGFELVVALDEAGVPVEKEFLSYLEREEKPLDIEHSKYAVMNFMRWKLKKEGGAACDAYLPALGKLDPEAFHVLLVNMDYMECAASADAAAKALGAEGKSTRMVACKLLGKFGSAEHLKKVQIIAEKDGYTEQKDQTVVYPVRDACSSAMAKIELRQ